MIDVVAERGQDKSEAVASDVSLQPAGTPDHPRPVSSDVPQPRRRTARYRGERVLVGARIRPAHADGIDKLCDQVGATRNDWIEAALKVAMAKPDEVAKALSVALPRHNQLTFDGVEEALDQSA